MKIFLSYSSKNRPKAEEIALALQAEGHEVFFDKDDLSGGEDFNAVIRKQIADANLFLFLISPDSVRQGAYSLSELRLAREKWPSPQKHVLPMLLDLTPRFFDLEDDQGRKAELLYFCCKASGEALGPGRQRQIQLLYRSPSGWEGKALAAHMIYFHISGLLPLVSATWSFRPLATAE